MPKRIQRKRAKGWRMPPGAIYVGDPTIYANHASWRAMGRAGATEWFRRETIPHWQSDAPDDFRQRLDELRGHDLVCWCPLTDDDGNPVPCHADVWLELANP